MQTLLTVLHIVVCVFLILVVLLQAGKGGGMGIAFGGAGSQTVFGSSGAGNFLTRLTTVTAAIFMVTSLGLAHYSSVQDSRKLQELAEKKAALKKADEAHNAQTKTGIEAAREAIEKATGGKVEFASPPPGAEGEPGPTPGAAQNPEEAAKAIQQQIEKELGGALKKGPAGKTGEAAKPGEAAPPAAAPAGAAKPEGATSAPPAADPKAKTKAKAKATKAAEDAPANPPATPAPAPAPPGEPPSP